MLIELEAVQQTRSTGQAACTRSYNRSTLERFTSDAAKGSKAISSSSFVQQLSKGKGRELVAILHGSCLHTSRPSPVPQPPLLLRPNRSSCLCSTTDAIGHQFATGLTGHIWNCQMLCPLFAKSLKIITAEINLLMTDAHLGSETTSCLVFLLVEMCDSPWQGSEPPLAHGTCWHWGICNCRATGLSVAVEPWWNLSGQ